MISNDLKTPESLDSLKDEVSFLKRDIQRYEVENNILREQLRLLKSQIYSAKTEKKLSANDDGQALLFNEAESYSTQEEKHEEITVPAYTRKKRGRRHLP